MPDWTRLIHALAEPYGWSMTLTSTEDLWLESIEHTNGCKVDFETNELDMVLFFWPDESAHYSAPLARGIMLDPQPTICHTTPPILWSFRLHHQPLTIERLQHMMDHHLGPRSWHRWRGLMMAMRLQWNMRQRHWVYENKQEELRDHPNVVGLIIAEGFYLMPVLERFDLQVLQNDRFVIPKKVMIPELNQYTHHQRLHAWEAWQDDLPSLPRWLQTALHRIVS